MKTKLFCTIIAFAVVGNIAFAQVPGSKSETPFAAIDGAVYKVGDTLTMGVGSEANGNFNYIYVPANVFLNTARRNYTHAAAGQRIVVKHFSVVKNSGTTYAVFTLASAQNACVNINLALESGELVSKNSSHLSKVREREVYNAAVQGIGRSISTLGNTVPANAMAQGSQQLSAPYSFLCYMKNKSSIKDYAIEYLFVHQWDLYREYADDEFNFQDVIDATTVFMEQKVSEIKDEQVFFINTKSEFGEYDFDKNLFSFTPLTLASYFTLHRWIYLGCEKCKTNTEVRLKFLNTHLFQGLVMDRDKANDLLKQRKPYSSINIDRGVSIMVYFTLVDSIEENLNPLGASRPNIVYLRANIDYIEVYDSYAVSRGTNMLLYTMRPAIQN